MKKLPIIISITLGIILPCFFYLFFIYKDSPPKTSLPKFEIQNVALPSSQLFEIREDKDVTQQILNGNSFLIFLKVGCEACKKDVETINKIVKKANTKIKFYGVTVEDKESIFNSFGNNVSFPLLFDRNSLLFKELQIRYFPTKLLINNGIIVKSWIGNFENEEKMLKELEIRSN
jgi:thiol-disulfide isomerase/thioredoxin